MLFSWYHLKKHKPKNSWDNSKLTWALEVYFKDLWTSVGQFTTATWVHSTGISPFPLKDREQETVSTFHKSTSTEGLKTTRILIDILGSPQSPNGFDRYEPLSADNRCRKTSMWKDRTEEKGFTPTVQIFTSLRCTKYCSFTVLQSKKLKS